MAKAAKQEGSQSVLRKIRSECILHERTPPFQIDPMLNFLLALFLFSCPLTVEDKPLDPAQVKLAVTELKSAYGRGRPADQLAMIKKYGQMRDSQIAETMLRGLKSKDLDVQLASINALRWMPFPVIVKGLQKNLQRNKALLKDDRLHEALVRSLGQHSDPSSLKYFMEGVYTAPTRGNFQARLYSIARIRTDESLLAVMEMLQRGAGVQANGKAKKQLQAKYDIALEVLTGQTFQLDKDAWLQWWRKNRKSFKVPKNPIKISPKSETQWSSYWANPKNLRGRGDTKKRK